MSTPAPRRIRMDISALKISRDYRLLFSAEVVTQLGNKMTYVALPFQMKVLTDSYLWVGAVGLADVIPLIIFGLYGGVLADAFDRRKIIVYAEIVSLIISVALLVYSLFSDQSPIVILVLAAFIAASGGLQSPAMESILPQVVPYQKLPSAMALNSSKNQSTAVVGPMIAGIILASGGVSYAYFIDVLSFFISISLFLKVKAMKPAHNAERPSLKRIKEGLQYAYSRKDLMGTYLIDISAMFFCFPLRTISIRCRQTRWGLDTWFSLRQHSFRCLTRSHHKWLVESSFSIWANHKFVGHGLGCGHSAFWNVARFNFCDAGIDCGRFF